MEPQLYAFSSFLRRIQGLKATAKLYHHLREVRAVDACKVRDLLVNAYEGLWAAMSPNMKSGIERVSNSVFGKFGIFCDAALPNLWIQFTAYQLGYPWHINTSAGLRFEYTAKTRTMFVDVYVLDQARPVYDMFGFVDLMGDGMRDLGRQLVLRCAIDSIRKHQAHSQELVYFGGNVVGYGKTTHDECHRPRVTLTSEVSEE